VPIGIAASGPRSGRLAAEHADVLISDQPADDVVRLFNENGGAGKPVYGQIPVSFGSDEEEARQHAHRLWKWGTSGWKAMSELPGPVNFEAASKSVRQEDVAEAVTCGADVERYVEAVRQWADIGFTHISFCQIGPERQKDFRNWAQAELLPALRERFS
jgi:G6PDH family F420-dependent oxidoreductase